LFVSTLVPPTSPGFGIILQAATPSSEKWTAMPLFLIASTVAGAVPFLLDKLLSLGGRNDFRFTSAMHKFIGFWPLTCWTKPAMAKVFYAAGGGKIGASTAVIVAHAAPFMGAQTTLMQRYFLPHPLDTIISQPFGMSEDLIAMAMAEAGSHPALASYSLTTLICTLNLVKNYLFTSTDRDGGDFAAYLICGINLVIGIAVAVVLPSAPSMSTFIMVFLQLFSQLVVGPLLGSCVSTCLFTTKDPEGLPADEELPDTPWSVTAVEEPSSKFPLLHTLQGFELAPIIMPVLACDSAAALVKPHEVIQPSDNVSTAYPDTLSNCTDNFSR